MIMDLLLFAYFVVHAKLQVGCSFLKRNPKFADFICILLLKAMLTYDTIGYATILSGAKEIYNEKSFTP